MCNVHRFQDIKEKNPEIQEYSPKYNICDVQNVKIHIHEKMD